MSTSTMVGTARTTSMPSIDTPIREGSRDGSSGECMLCGKRLASARARYCTRACQQRSYRLRHTTTVDLTSARKILQRRKELVAHTIYECSGCGERFVGERRCTNCNVFCRALGLGGSCAECDAPVLLDDLLGEGVIPTE